MVSDLKKLTVNYTVDTHKEKLHCIVCSDRS